MGRGRVELKRIENKISRQVTFSKRRSGLLKKAHEISVLCDAQVALVVFSTKGKLYQYSTDSSMETILEKYERYSYAESQLTATDDHDTESQNCWSLELPRLKANVEALQRNLRHYAGEELDSLTLREHQNLEQQLDIALKRIRTRKNQLMQESISELQRKEKALQGQNNELLKKLKENEKTMPEHEQLQLHNLGHTPSTLMPRPSPSPCLTMGGAFQITREDEEAQAPPCSTSNMPPWMLRHVYQ